MKFFPLLFLPLLMVVVMATSASSDDEDGKSQARAAAKGQSIYAEIVESHETTQTITQGAKGQSVPTSSGGHSGADEHHPTQGQHYAAEVASDGTIVACIREGQAAGPYVQACGGAPVRDKSEKKPKKDESEAVIITVTASDFAELPLAPSGIEVQPNRSWVLVNKDTIAFTSDDPQVLETVLLGNQVAIRATPVAFMWNFGQGSGRFTTDHPGAPYPNHSIAYGYRQASESESVLLTTTWVGEFQVNGRGPWIPIVGTAETTSRSEPFEVREVRTRLVPGPGNS